MPESQTSRLPRSPGLLQRSAAWDAPAEDAARGLPLLISTMAIPLTPLQASQRLPSGVGIMFRTTPPPDGIVHVWNFSVLESKRTTVFGFTPDSLYQMTLPIVVMP